MNDSDITDILLSIHRAVDRCFMCYRRDHPEYKLPLRLMEGGSAKYNCEEHYTVTIRHGGEQKNQSVWLIQPIVMAVGFARQYGIEDSDIMAFWGIETGEELRYKLACFDALNIMAAKALEKGGKELYESNEEGGQGYRWWLKYSLVENHIRLHQKKKLQFFDNNLLKY